jgi:hypothetical protein
MVGVTAGASVGDIMDGGVMGGGVDVGSGDMGGRYVSGGHVFSLKENRKNWQVPKKKLCKNKL